jgi:hypothetical protein
VGRPASLGRSVRTPGEDRVLPPDDTRQLHLTLGDGVGRTITAIPSETVARAAHDIVTAVAGDGRVDTSRREQAAWDDEGGQGERPISSGTSAHAAVSPGV